eukprot:397050-Hanusia_phi.AAC.1
MSVVHPVRCRVRGPAWDQVSEEQISNLVELTRSRHNSFRRTVSEGGSRGEGGRGRGRSPAVEDVEVQSKLLLEVHTSSSELAASRGGDASL